MACFCLSNAQSHDREAPKDPGPATLNIDSLTREYPGYTDTLQQNKIDTDVIESYYKDYQEKKKKESARNRWGTIFGIAILGVLIYRLTRKKPEVL